MKRGLEYLIAVILIATAIGAGIFALTSRDKADKVSTAASVQSQAPANASNKACSLFSFTDAKQLLGPSAKGGPNAEVKSSADLDVSFCIYSQGSGSKLPVSGSKTATLLVTAPKTDKGIQSNQNQFGRLKPATAQDVSGYGDAAYWDASHGQLNILKNNTWYILSYGPVSPANRTLDQTKQLADLLAPKM